jgi:hypothetical protein
MSSLNPSKPTYSWSAPCFAQNTAVFSKSNDGKTLNLEVTSSSPVSLTCSDLYAAFTVSTVAISTEIKSSRNPVVTNIALVVPEDVTDAELWDIDNKGVRLFRYVNDKITTVSNLIETLKMFVPETTQEVSEEAAMINIDFMKKYTGFNFPPRDPALNIIPDESEIKSGDTFYIIRMDGLDPLLAWAMGSSTGHVTTAIWIDGELFVCESTIADSYWPTDYVQKTPYRTWIQQAQDADMQVVFAPLNDQARKNYNETAAVDFFHSVEGIDYGFQTMIWAWLDTALDNFPCLPPDFSSNCMQWEILEPVIALVDRYVNEIGDQIWNAGLAKRLNSDVMRTAALYQEGARQGYTSMNQVIPIVEQDAWLYNTTRWGQPYVGKAMVCCVFVCNTWKEAGVFGDLKDEINCAEFTNWDDYSLTIHADNYRQIIGDYTLTLNNFHTKDPYAHMAEHCPAYPPDYAKPSNC